MRGEAGEGGGIDFVEVVEDGNLVTAKEISGAGIADVAGVAGVEDAGVVVHEESGGFADKHAGESGEITLICQIKVSAGPDRDPGMLIFGNVGAARPPHGIQSGGWKAAKNCRGEES